MSTAGLVFASLVGCLLAALPSAYGASSTDTPLLKVRLVNHLTSYDSKPGSKFRAVVVADYQKNGRVLIPRGGSIEGEVRSATSVGIGIRHERAGLTLAFYQYRAPAGRRFPLKAQLVAVENAREKVMPNGHIRGILAAQNPSGLLGGFWYNPSSGFFFLRSAVGLTGLSHQLAGAFSMGMPAAPAILAVRCAVFRFPEPEIQLPPGTDMNLEVTSLSANIPSFPVAAPAELPENLAAKLDELPREVRKPNGHRVNDIINVVFLGSRQDVIQSFAAAGWLPADKRSARSFSREYLAFSAKRNYSTAPVSKLLYEGALPDLVFQKSLNTVSKRDHVRIWHSGTINGEDIWVGAATHDSGIIFHAGAFALSHSIDGTLDVERSKIVDDLSFAGCSTPVAYFHPAAGFERNADGLVATDDRLAVVTLHDCMSIWADEAHQHAPPPPGNKLKRMTRRFILESRNYVLRENAYYWTYHLIRYHGLTEQ